MSETPEYQPEQPKQKFECQYTNETGDIICVAKFELAQKRIGVKYPGERLFSSEIAYGRILHSLVLEGISQNSQKNTVDVLKIANPHELKIVITRREPGDYRYVDDQKTITAPPPSDQLNLGVLLHELGHGEQSRDPVTKQIKQISLHSIQIGLLVSGTPDDLFEEIQKIGGAIPEAKKIIDSISPEIQQIKEEITRLFKERSDVSWELYLSGKQEKTQTVSESMDALQKRKKEIYKKLADIIERYRIEEILRMPSILMEEDATMRAIEWMKQIKCAGIDLMAQTKVPTEKLPKNMREQCGNNEHTTTDIHKVFDAYLKEYKTKQITREKT